MDIKLAKLKDIDGWMQLINKVKGSLPGLETKEALEFGSPVQEFVLTRANIF